MNGTQYAPTLSPVQLPDGGALEYNGGDVRHIGPTSVLDSSSISSATRNLAFRDVKIAQVVNSLVAAVNNKEVATPIAPPRISLAAGESLVVSNFKVPNGFQARVVDAAVSSAGNAVQLDVEYSEFSFGESTGTESLISTTTSFDGGTGLRGQGEFIFRVTNMTAARASVSVSSLVAIRPASVGQSSVVPGVKGEKGDRGDTGDAGVKGDPGTPGAQGAAGVRYRGEHSVTLAYAVNDLVTYTGYPLYGVVVYIALQPNIAVVPPDPSSSPSADWAVFIVGAEGAQGTQGPVGLYYAGVYNSLTTYNNGAIVTTTGSASSSWVSNTTQVGIAPPAPSWDQLFGPFYGPGFQSVGVSLAPVGDSSFQSSPSGLYTNPSEGLQFIETTTYGGSSFYTSASRLSGQARWNVSGEARIRLPQQADGFVENWTTDESKLAITGHVTMQGTLVAPMVIDLDADSLKVRVPGYGNVEITVTGERLGNLTGTGAGGAAGGSGGSLRAWVYFDGQPAGTGAADCTILGGMGIYRVRRNSTGRYTFYLTAPAPNLNYGVMSTAAGASATDTARGMMVGVATGVARTLTQCDLNFSVDTTEIGAGLANPRRATIAVLY